MKVYHKGVTYIDLDMGFRALYYYSQNLRGEIGERENQTCNNPYVSKVLQHNDSRVSTSPKIHKLLRSFKQG